MDNSWKQIAWNGIRFKIPVGWEVVQIGARHLILEDEALPVMEIKWGAVKGVFSHRNHLKRLAALQSRRNKISVAEWILPPHWEKALTGFKAGGFLWQSPAASGRGAILFCVVCRTATLIQFFGDSSFKREKVFLTVLKSFRDHSKDGWLPWSIFDIRVTLPQSLQLKRFRFEAGKFELVFTAGRHSIYLHRWAPAAALLAGRDLIAFAETVPEFTRGAPRSLTVNHCEAIEWEIIPGNDWWRKLSRFKVKSSYFFFRLWHLDKQNRILGVRAEGKYPIDILLVNQICEHYESL
ncbi:MAG: hypothetical protein KJO34_10410 [Deltaproteobacteria bacterium]|nr:hypothetical protein [Deltaproteobacteria bacterium]